jgi:hypothetical protein
MGAETTIWVEVLVTHHEWREVSAVTLQEAVEKAGQWPGVVDVVNVQYEAPADEASASRT